MVEKINIRKEFKNEIEASQEQSKISLNNSKMSSLSNEKAESS